MSHRTRFLVAVAVLNVGLIGCSPVGLSRDQAIAAAVEAVPAGTTALWVEFGPLARFRPEGSMADHEPDREVWAVMLNGRFPFPCVVNARGQPVCPPDATRTLVVLDYFTGEFIYSETR